MYTFWEGRNENCSTRRRHNFVEKHTESIKLKPKNKTQPPGPISEFSKVEYKDNI